MQQLKKMNRAYRASAPSKADTEASYARFLHSVKIYDATTSEVSRPQSFFSLVPQFARATLRKATMVAVMMVLIVGVGTSVVRAFPNKLPGDFFYGVRLAAERAQVSLARKPARQAQLELEFAGRRVEEAATIAHSSLPNREERLAKAVAQFRSHMEKTELNLKHADRAQATVEVAKTVDRKSAEYGAALERAGVQSSGSVLEDVRDAQGAAQSASIAAVTVLLDSQRDGQLSLDDLRKTVRGKLWELENGLQAAAYRLSLIPGDAYPEIDAVGGPELTTLYQDLGFARAELESGKDFFARGGYEASLAHYRNGIGMLNHLTWAASLYEKTLTDREAAKAATVFSDLDADQ